MATKTTARRTSWRQLVLASIVAASLAAGSAEARGSSLVGPNRLYHYSRRPDTLDLMGDIFSMPIYFNSLVKQKEAQIEQLHRSAPRYYVDEGPDGSELVMEVPGVTASDLNVELEDGHMLHVSGTRRYIQKGKPVESNFDQMFRMDDGADVDNISVTLSSGILRVTEPRKEKTIKKLPIAVHDEKPAVVDSKDNADVSDGSEREASNVEEVDGLAIIEEDAAFA